MERNRTGAAGRRLRRGSFTIIELLIVTTVIATVVAILIPRYLPSIDHSKELVLKQSLVSVRNAIDRHYGDTGRYPESLQELVDRHYLGSLPIDPVTESAATWKILPPVDASKGGVYDLRSGALGSTADGTPYSQL